MLNKSGPSIDTAQKMKFSITDFFSKCDQIRSGKLHFLCSVTLAELLELFFSQELKLLLTLLLKLLLTIIINKKLSLYEIHKSLMCHGSMSQTPLKGL